MKFEKVLYFAARMYIKHLHWTSFLKYLPVSSLGTSFIKLFWINVKAPYRNFHNESPPPIDHEDLPSMAVNSGSM